jgi:hypothetical protein
MTHKKSLTLLYAAALGATTLLPYPCTGVAQDGGITHTGFSPLPNLQSAGAITVDVFPSDIRSGSGWAIPSRSSTYRYSGYILSGLAPQSYTLRFQTSLPNYQKPPDRAFPVNAGQLTRVAVVCRRVN